MNDAPAVIVRPIAQIKTLYNRDPVRFEILFLHSGITCDPPPFPSCSKRSKGAYSGAPLDTAKIDRGLFCANCKEHVIGIRPDLCSISLITGIHFGPIEKEIPELVAVSGNLVIQADGCYSQ